MDVVLVLANLLESRSSRPFRGNHPSTLTRLLHDQVVKSVAE